MASATTVNCVGVDGKPNFGSGVCGGISPGSSMGMYFGDDLSSMNQIAKTQLTGFIWGLPNGDYYQPQYKANSKTITITDLHFNFGGEANGNVTGTHKTNGINEIYTITIDKANTNFILNVGEQMPLATNLDINFGETRANYYLNAKRLRGIITLEGSGTFTAYLTEGMEGKEAQPQSGNVKGEFINNGSTAIIHQTSNIDTAIETSAAIITKGGSTTWKFDNAVTAISLDVGNNDHSKFSILANNNGSNTINAQGLALTTKGHIMAGGRQSPSKGTNIITVDTLTLSSGTGSTLANIAVAGAGADENDRGLNKITATGKITLAEGNIQSYFWGTNDINAKELELTKGSITAGDRGNPTLTGAKNTITLTGTGTLSVAGADQGIIAYYNGKNKISADGAMTINTIQASALGENELTFKANSEIKGHILADKDRDKSNTNGDANYIGNKGGTNILDIQKGTLKFAQSGEKQIVADSEGKNTFNIASDATLTLGLDAATSDKAIIQTAKGTNEFILAGADANAGTNAGILTIKGDLNNYGGTLYIGGKDDNNNSIAAGNVTIDSKSALSANGTNAKNEINVTDGILTFTDIFASGAGAINSITIDKSSASSNITLNPSGDFTIRATEGGKNIINAQGLELKLSKKVMAGTRGANNAGESRTGTNEITVKSLTIADGGIAVAGVNGTPSKNTITAIGDNGDTNNPKGAITLTKGSIQSYFYGTNEIKAGELKLTEGSITAGETAAIHTGKGEGKNIIKLGDGTLTLGGTATEAIAQIISSNGGANTITAGAIDTAGNISADGGTNIIKLTGALTFKGTGQYAGNIISSNDGANNITADSLTLTGELSADGGNNTLTLEGVKVTNSSIAGNIIANGGTNTLNVDGGTLKIGETKAITITSDAVDSNNIFNVASGANLVIGAASGKEANIVTNQGKNEFILAKAEGSNTENLNIAGNFTNNGGILYIGGKNNASAGILNITSENDLAANEADAKNVINVESGTLKFASILAGAEGASNSIAIEGDTPSTITLNTDKAKQKFSIWAKNGGTNAIAAKTAALTTAGNITAGVKGDGSNSEQGINNITVASLTMTDGDISTAGTDGSKEGDTGYSLNSINAGNGNIVLEGKNAGQQNKGNGDIIAYFHGENRITAENLTLNKGNITAGHRDIPKKGALNKITVTGALELKNTASGKGGIYAYFNDAQNIITAGSIKAKAVSAEKASNILTINGTDASEIGLVVARNSGKNEITFEKGDNNSITDQIIVDGNSASNVFNIKSGTLKYTGAKNLTASNQGQNIFNVADKANLELGVPQSQKATIVADNGTNAFILTGTGSLTVTGGFRNENGGILYIGGKDAQNKSISAGILNIASDGDLYANSANAKNVINVKSGTLSFASILAGAEGASNSIAIAGNNGGTQSTITLGKTLTKHSIWAKAKGKNTIDAKTATLTTDGKIMAGLKGATEDASQTGTNTITVKSLTIKAEGIAVAGVDGTPSKNTINVTDTITLTAGDIQSYFFGTNEITAGSLELTAGNIAAGETEKKLNGDPNPHAKKGGALNQIKVDALNLVKGGIYAYFNDAQNIITAGSIKAKAVSAEKASNILTINGSADSNINIVAAAAGGTNTITFKDTNTIAKQIVANGEGAKNIFNVQAGTLNFKGDKSLSGDKNLTADNGGKNTFNVSDGANLVLGEAAAGSNPAKEVAIITANEGRNEFILTGTGSLAVTGDFINSGGTLYIGGQNAQNSASAGNLTINSTSDLSANGTNAKNVINVKQLKMKVANIVSGNGGSNEITIADNNASIETAKIVANDGGTNQFNIDSEKFTFGGIIEANGNGENIFKFTSGNTKKTLALEGNNNTITTLKLENKDNVINLAGDISKNNQVLSGRTDFRLLTIAPKTGTGFDNPNNTTLTFESYINLDAAQSEDLSKNAKLGGENASDAQNQYGYAYSDRVIIHNAGNNQDQAKGTYKFKAYYGKLDESDLGADKYKEGGTETQGNIALFTIAKLDGSNDKGVINLETSGDNKSQAQSTTRSGLDAITTTLTQVATDQYGKTANSTGALQESDKDYLTYFVNKVEVASSDSGTGGGGDNSQIGHIIRDSNLMIQSMAVSAVNLYLANFNSLNKRMGELRDNAYSKGVWARTFIGSQSNDFGLSDRTGYFSLQAGFDGALKREKANNFIGFAISYSKNFGYSSTKNNARSLNSGVRAPELGIDSLNAQLLELALYNSYVSNEGWYNDTIGKFSYIQNSMSVKDRLGANAGGINGASGKFNTFAFTLSNEVGYRAKLGEDKAWFIDPQAELALGHINGVNFSLNHYRINQATATISSAINLRARAGASIGYDFKNFTQDKGIDAKVYVGAFYEMDSFHYTDGSKGIKYTTKLKDTREVKMLDTDHRAVLNVGTNLTIKDATRIYLDFEKSFGGKITTDYKINAGVRYSFGEALSEKGKEVLKDKESESVESEAKAPLKLEEKDKQAKVEEKGEQDKAQG